MNRDSHHELLRWLRTDIELDAVDNGHGVGAHAGELAGTGRAQGAVADLAQVQRADVESTVASAVFSTIRGEALAMAILCPSRG